MRRCSRRCLRSVPCMVLGVGGIMMWQALATPKLLECSVKPPPRIQMGSLLSADVRERNGASCFGWVGTASSTKLGKLEIAIKNTQRHASMLTADLLQEESFATTDAIIDLLEGDPVFEDLARQNLNDIVERDQLDGERLKEGVQSAVEDGRLVRPPAQTGYDDINVLKMDANERARYIVGQLPADGQGCVVILVGLSGTGKGTTCNAISKLLPSAMLWSNGDCFRALTLLAMTHANQIGKPDLDSDCLTTENLDAWADMLEFKQDDSGKFDVYVNGLGLVEQISKIKNTKLKDPKLSRRLPDVARVAQAQVVKFAQKAVERASQAGRVVLLEGREETLDFIASKYRFRLLMPEVGQVLLGKRLAAQRIAAATKMKLKDELRGDSKVDAETLVRESLVQVAQQ